MYLVMVSSVDVAALLYSIYDSICECGYNFFMSAVMLCSHANLLRPHIKKNKNTLVQCARV